MENLQIPDIIGDHFTQILYKKLPELEKLFNIKIALRGNKIICDGEASERIFFKEFINQIIEIKF